MLCVSAYSNPVVAAPTFFWLFLCVGVTLWLGHSLGTLDGCTGVPELFAAFAFAWAGPFVAGVMSYIDVTMFVPTTHASCAPLSVSGPASLDKLGRRIDLRDWSWFRD